MPDKTCLTCKNNDDGRCRLTGQDMYEFRFTEPRFGGCGIEALKHEPLYEEIEVEERPRQPYSWRNG